MSEEINGLLAIKDSSGASTRAEIDGDLAAAGIGGGDADGSFVVRDGKGNVLFSVSAPDGELQVRLADGTPVLRFTGSSGQLSLAKAAGDTTISADAEKAEVHIGGGGVRGNLALHPSTTGASRTLSSSSIHLDADDAAIRLGAEGRDGDLFMNDNSGARTVHLDGQEANLMLGGNGRDGDLALYPTESTHGADWGTMASVHLNGQDAGLRLGGAGKHGDLYVNNSAGNRSVHLVGRHGNLHLGGNGSDGDLACYRSGSSNSDGFDVASVHIDGEQGNLRLGGSGADGDLLINDSNGMRTVHLNGEQGNLRLGGNGKDGDLACYRAGQNNVNDFAFASVHIDGEQGNLRLGGGGADGDIYINDSSGSRTAHLNGEQGNLRLGGNGKDGDLACYRAGQNNVDDFAFASVHIDGEQGNLRLGGDGVDGDLFIRDSSGTQTIHLNGDAGDIILENADTAEDFEIAGKHDVAPGTVMVIDDSGKLCSCARAYDRRVAGVISGAGELRPGIILGRTSAPGTRMPVALNGRTYCLVDATDRAVKVGDLLTTSQTPGHAMRADDPLAAFGAVIGKAMAPLDDGIGLIPILVSLQ
jgi:hypothetical protein